MLFWVVDAADVDRIEESRIELHKFVSTLEHKNGPVIVFANKSDLSDAMDARMIAKKLDLDVCYEE